MDASSATLKVFFKNLIPSLDIENFSKHIKEVTFFDDYSKYTVFAIMVLCGNNYTPINITQRFFFVLMFYIGALCDAIIFGHMALLFNKLNHLQKLKTKKMNEIEQYMKYLKLNNTIKKDIEHYYDTLWWRHREMFIDKNLMKDLNPSLKIKLSLMKMNSELFSISPVFSKFSNNFMVFLISKLKTCLIYLNDIVIFEGTCERKMYFIGKLGKFTVKINGNWVKNLEEGNYFGEISYFMKSGRRTATVN